MDNYLIAPESTALCVVGDGFLRVGRRGDAMAGTGPVGYDWTYDLERDVSRLEVKAIGMVGERDLARHVIGGERRRMPRPTRVIARDVATVAFFDDGTKAVTRRSPDDEPDERLGLATCAVKRVRGLRADDWEDVMRQVSHAKPREMRRLADAISLLADMTSVEVERQGEAGTGPDSGSGEAQMRLF